MPSAIGVPGLYPISLGGGGVPLYTTIVTNDAELATALTTNGGDTFIVAGSYSIDTDTLGALDTTPRTFTGAGISDQTNPFVAGNGVNILFEGAGGAHSSLDFTAGLTEATGVSFENLNLVSDTAALSSFLVGIAAGTNLYMNAQTLTFIGIADSRNLHNCRFVNPAAGSIGFFGTTHLTNCTVGDKTIGGAETGFFICEQLTNCSVYYESGATGSFVNAFQFCSQLTNCRADFQDVTSIGGGTNNAFNACLEMTNCLAIGPSVGAIAGLFGLDSCERVTNCNVTRFAQNYDLCDQLTNCTSEQAVGGGTDGTHFTASSRLTNCKVNGTGDDVGINGFFSCSFMANCEALSCTDNGFEQCGQMSNCTATGATNSGHVDCVTMTGCEGILNGAMGFIGCDRVSTSRAVSNAADGFNSSTFLSGCESITNTIFGYAAVCTQVSNCGGAGNGGGLSDFSNLIADPVTAAGI